MVDAIISTVVTQLGAIIEQQIREELLLVVNVDDEIEKLITTFESIQAVILDAEKKQIKEADVKLWLQRLRDVSYDMDDVLDDWSTALFKLQMEKLENNSPKKKVFSFITFPCSCFGKVVERRDIALEIKRINQRLDQIDLERKKYGFSDIPNSTQGTVTLKNSSDRPKTSSYVDASKVHGRDKDKTNLVKKLKMEDSNQLERQMGLNVVSLVGMGGIGKTTLAGWAYNSQEVIDHFDRRMWVVVSEPFDVVRIAKAIVEDTENMAPVLFELEPVLRRLRELIERNKYLLVLDDVWTDEYGLWDHLISSLASGASGSTILVTTRKEKVARIMGCSDPLHLDVLSDQDCWDLFSQHAFSGRSKEDIKRLEPVGKRIADKCKGLPLAAKTMGSLLHFKYTVQEWENVLGSDMWELEEAEKAGLFAPLLLSYYDLTPALRRCFSYCAIFPKDTEIEADNLIKLWMAQGYISLKENADMEVIGRQYLDNLAMRCFFQDLKRDKGSDYIVRFKMHDMVHDVARYLTSDECGIVEVDHKLEQHMDSSRTKIRHLTLMRSQDVSFPSSLGNSTKLHTFWVQSFYDCPQLVSELDKISSAFFQHLLHLRAFDISRNRFQELPKEIGLLLNLRYLNLSHNPLIELPEMVCDLYNLQTLKLISCKHLERLPHGIGKLQNLRHLEMDRTDRLRKLPKGIARLCSLRTISKFVLSSSKDDGTCTLGDLKDLNKLQGCLKFEGLGYVTNVADAEKAELKNKQLVDLHMDFKPLLPSSMPTAAVAEALKLHTDVQFLTISSFGGTQFPSWIHSLHKLRKLQLQDCQNCTHLPPLGKLQSLETLCIVNMHGVKGIGSEFLGVETDDNGAKKANGGLAVDIFPKLKKLKLEGMSSWKEWDVKNAEGEVECGNLRFMPCLRYLKLSGCGKLEELPEVLLQKAPIRKLRVQNCTCLQRKYGNNSGEQWPRSHIQKVHISPN